MHNERAPMKKIAALTLVCLSALTLSARAEDSEGWITLFDGKTFKGWKASENKSSWKIDDGAFVCFGPRSHLFYVGDHAPFKNFHFKCEVKTTKGSNSGIYIHSKYQQNGWPSAGYEVQVNQTHGDKRKSGSIYAVKDVLNVSPAKDNEWYTQEIIVKGKTITVKINGKVVNEYTEPADNKNPTRKLDKGTFAFQAHDPKSKVMFRKIQVKKLD